MRYLYFLISVILVALPLGANAQLTAMTQSGETAEFSSLKILYAGNDGTVEGFSVSRDQRYMALANERKVIKLFDGKTGKFYRRIPGYHNNLLQIILLPGGERLLSAGHDNTLAILDLKNGDVLKTLKMENEPRSIDINGDGSEVAVGDHRGNIVFVDLKTLTVIKSLPIGDFQISSLAYSPDYSKLAVGTGAGVTYMFRKSPIAIVDPKSKIVIQTFEAVIGATTALKWSNDSRKLYSGHKANKRVLRVWDVQAATGTSLQGKVNLVSNSGYVGIEISGDNTVLIATTDDQSVEIYDLPSGTQISKKARGKFKMIRTLQFTAKSIFSFNGGKNFIIGGYNKNLLYIFSADKKAVTGYFHSFNDEWAVIATDGRMDGSQDAIKNLVWDDGTDQVPLETTFDKNFSPRLLTQLITSTPSKEFDVKKAATGMPQLEIAMMDGRAYTVSKTSTSLTTAKKNIQVKFKVTKFPGEIEEISLHQNSKLVDSQKGNGQSDYTFDITLGDAFGNENFFFITALSKSGIETEKKTFVINYQGKTAEPARLFIFTVGINQYKNSKYNLNYALADANELEKKLVSGGTPLFSEVIRISLRDGRATRDEILKGFASIKAKAKEQDIMIFYYAGHGVMSDGKTGPSDFYLVPNDVTQLYGRDDLLKSKGISATEVKELSKNINAQKQVYILDACQSSGALETVAARGAVEEKALAQLARSTGTFWITATGTQQFATEFKDLGHGVFTYAILEGLSGKADNGDQRITIKELSSYIENRVPELSEKYKGAAQFPSGYSYGNDFPIAIVK